MMISVQQVMAPVLRQVPTGKLTGYAAISPPTGHVKAIISGAGKRDLDYIKSLYPLHEYVKVEITSDAVKAVES